MNKSWKTTTAGLFLAVLIAIQPVIKEHKISYPDLIIAVGIAVFGFVSKDHDATGGTREIK